jgi:ABC-type nitrate/sulfonate/bicarbonate transport system substrate-binding protein
MRLIEVLPPRLAERHAMHEALELYRRASIATSAAADIGHGRTANYAPLTEPSTEEHRLAAIDLRARGADDDDVTAGAVVVGDERTGSQMADERGSQVSVDKLTEAAFSGVLAALRANELKPERWPGPILVGIIAWPELSQFGGQVAGGLREREQ